MEYREEKLAELEALLFIHGEPLARANAEKILGITKEELDILVAEIESRLGSSDRGLLLVSDDKRVQLATKPAFAAILETFIKEELSEDLTPASLEALSLIAYLGPLSRSRLEYIRGVNSIFILRNLLMRGLIERFADPERPQGFLYKPSFECLRHLGVAKQEDLPEYEKFRSLLSSFETQSAA